MPKIGSTWRWHGGVEARTKSTLADVLALENMRRKRVGAQELTLWKLSEELEIDYRTLSKWERDDTDNFNGQVLAALCLYFGCTPDDLLQPTATAKMGAVQSDEDDTLGHPAGMAVVASG
jgi:DNA-binding Xre family transcriptional regulator